MKEMRAAVFATHSAGESLDKGALAIVDVLLPLFHQVVVVHSCNTFTPRHYRDGNVVYCRVLNSAGRDFAKYLVGLELLYSTAADDTVLLMNDSCTLTSAKALSEMVTAALSAPAEFVAVTDSYVRSYHLQSYFWLLKRATLVHSLLQYLQKHQPNNVLTKRELIDKFEIGFCKHVRRELGDVRLHALFPVELVADIAGRKHTNVNPSYDYPDLLRQLGCGLLKKLHARQKRT
jgi:hypothetical protein